MQAGGKGQRICRDNIPPQTLPARHKLTQRGSTRLCRAKRRERTYTGQCGRHNKGCHGEHIPQDESQPHAVDNDSAGTRRIELQRYTRRERTAAGTCHRRDAERLCHAGTSHRRLRLGQQLAGGTLRNNKCTDITLMLYRYICYTIACFFY